MLGMFVFLDTGDVRAGVWVVRAACERLEASVML